MRTYHKETPFKCGYKGVTASSTTQNLSRRHIRVVLKVRGGHLTFNGTATAS